MRHFPVPLLALVTAIACSDASDVPLDVPEPLEPDTSEPFVIVDRGGEAGAPLTYKGLPLRLEDNGQPGVTPVNGRIALVCVGMSNSNQECGAFINGVQGQWAAEIDAAIVVVNCAVGGHAIERWIDPAFDGVLWDRCRDETLPLSGVTPAQVRVIYHKAADQFTTKPGGGAKPPYPDPQSDYAAFFDNLTAFALRVNTEFPSVQAVYTSSPIYAGFTTSASRGEPLSYEVGHALNAWLAANQAVDGVWYGWGPYSLGA